MFAGNIDAVAVVGDDAGIVHAFVEEKALAFSPKFALIFVAYGGIYRFDGNFSVGFHLFDYGVPFRCLHFDEPFGCFIGLVVPVKGFGRDKRHFSQFDDGNACRQIRFATARAVNISRE